MKDILSYYDIPLIIVLIYLAVLKWKQYNIYLEERKQEIEFDESRGKYDRNKSNSLRLSERYTKTSLLLVIGCGVLAIYNRLIGNMPNIFAILEHMLIGKYQEK